MTSSRLVVALAIAAAVTFPASAEENVTTAPGIEVEPVISTIETIIGQPIAYPDGTPEVTAAILTVPPGVETGFHTHPTPLFGYVLEGTLTVDYGSRGTRSFEAGDSLIEAIDWPHNGMNLGDVPVRILTVFSGAQGVANATPVAE